MQEISFVLGSGVISVTGTINGFAADFVKTAPQVWTSEANRSADGKYVLDLTVVDLKGTYNYVLSRYFFYDWTPPVFDRTEQDVNQKRPKGYLNYHDLNRIESNCQYLRDVMTQYGYAVAIPIKTDWTTTDMPYFEELERVRLNVGTISDNFYRLPTTPPLPLTTDGLDYIAVNNLEEILNDTKYLLDNLIISFRYAGTFYSGGEGLAIGYS